MDKDDRTNPPSLRVRGPQLRQTGVAVGRPLGLRVRGAVHAAQAVRRIKRGHVAASNHLEVLETILTLIAESEQLLEAKTLAKLALEVFP